MIEVKEKITFTLENDDKVYDSDNQDIIILLPELKEYNKKLIHKKYKTNFIDQYLIDKSSIIGDFQEDLAYIKINSDYVFINKKGYILPRKFKNVSYFNEGLALTQKDNNSNTNGCDVFEYIDGEENTVLKISCDLANEFHEGLARIMKDNLYGYIDRTGKEIIPCQYLKAKDFSNGFAIVLDQECKVCIIDKEGNKKAILKEAYNLIDFHSYSNDLALCRFEINFLSCFNYMNKKQEFQITLDNKYQQAYDFVNGFAIVVDKNGYGFIDKTGKEVIPCQYERAQNFSGNLAPVLKEVNGKWGYIDKNNQVKIPFQYDEAYPFRDGLALVEKNGLYGYITQNGLEKIPCIYKSAREFKEGLALVKDETGKYFINTHGSKVIPNATLNKSTIFYSLIDRLTNDTSTTYALDLNTASVHLVTSWDKKITITNSQNDTIILSQEDYQELTKKLAKK